MWVSSSCIVLISPLLSIILNLVNLLKDNVKWLNIAVIYVSVETGQCTEMSVMFGCKVVPKF